MLVGIDERKQLQKNRIFSVLKLLVFFHQWADWCKLESSFGLAWYLAGRNRMATEPGFCFSLS